MIEAPNQANAPQVVYGKDKGYFIVQLKDRPRQGGWLLLLYGPSGSGKSWFCGTAGRGALYINIGMGIDTIQSPLFRTRHPDCDEIFTVDVADIINQEGRIENATAFDVVCDIVAHALSDDSPHEIDTIILDDATFLRRAAMNRGLEVSEGDRKKKRGHVLDDWIPTEVGDYKQEMQAIEWFLAKHKPLFKSKGVNFVLTAHERKEYGKPPRIGDEAPLKRVLPGFTGKTFPDVIPAYFDDVFRMEVVGGAGNQAFRMITTGNELERGKSRHNGVFPPIIVNPNYREMLALLQKNELHSYYKSNKR